MKIIIIFLLLLNISYAFPGDSTDNSSTLQIQTFDGKCPICKLEGKKSIVEPGMCSMTLMFCGNGYYDEDGNFHAPNDCNKTTCSYSCSNGHKF